MRPFKRDVLQNSRKKISTMLPWWWCHKEKYFLTADCYNPCTRLLYYDRYIIIIRNENGVLPHQKTVKESLQCSVVFPHSAIPGLAFGLPCYWHLISLPFWILKLNPFDDGSFKITFLRHPHGIGTQVKLANWNHHMCLHIGALYYRFNGWVNLPTQWGSERSSWYYLSPYYYLLDGLITLRPPIWV